ncbi:MAG: hypothetical protein A2Z96_01015 [Spirochaetes bacterium GWB1_48_6]|nr:MAG: hypothetical protein A2Z96_01015 [Spirochaetes bacterium GWB1_48_6]
MRKSHILLGILLLGLSLGAGGWAYWVYRQDQQELVRFSLASQVLTGVYNQTRIQTADAFYQVLFPFDFLPYDTSAWKTLKAQSTARRPIPPVDWETLELVRLARKIGFDPELGKFGFLVLNIRVRAGMDLEKNPMEIELEPSERGRVLVLRLPTPRITDFQVLDFPEGVRFPGIPLAPLDWKQLIQRLKPRIIAQVLKDGLLAQGQESGEKIFDRIIRSSGFPRYEIIWKSPTEQEPGDRG